MPGPINARKACFHPDPWALGRRNNVSRVDRILKEMSYDHIFLTNSAISVQVFVRISLMEQMMEQMKCKLESRRMEKI